MHYCNQCRVHLRGRGLRCVLCGNTLSAPDAESDREEVFPDIPPAFESHMALRIMIFISSAVVIASFALRLLFPTDVNWPIYVLFGLISMWLGLIIVLRKRHNIPKTIVWQVTVVSGLSLLWDLVTGWRGWSLDYFIPIVYVAAIIVMYITAKIMKLGIRIFVIYAFIACLFGIIPVLFIALGWVNTLYPSIICVAVSVIFLAAIIIFQGDNIKKELGKGLHI
jgi:hypothetical protein